MARAEVTGRKASAYSSGADDLPSIRGPPIVYSIREFCAAHGISVSMFFKLRNQGLGPKQMAVGSRRLITAESAAVWRAEREAETAVAQNTTE